MAQTVQIERRRCPSASEFAERYLRGEGCPVILTDAISGWPALSTWTFDRFLAQYGRDFVRLSRGVFSTEPSLVTNLSGYIAHLDSPDDYPPGFWLGDDGKPMRTAPPPSALPLYLLQWRALERHPELWADIRPGPSGIEDWTQALDDQWREILDWASGVAHTEVYLGPAGTLSRLHRDFYGTHSYLAQVVGRKQVTLFAPAERELIYSGAVDLAHPDLEAHPRFAEATAHEGVIGPGEILFTPHHWWHQVRALEKSITVSHNFFNHSNAQHYLSALFANLPNLEKALEKRPEWRPLLSGLAHKPAASAP